MPKVKLHAITGKIGKNHVALVINTKNKYPYANAKKILHQTGGYNIAEILDVELSKPITKEYNGNKWDVYYINSLKSSVDKEGNKKEGVDPVVFFVNDYVFKGVSKEGKDYFLSRRPGFWSEEENKTVISDNRREVNFRIISELLKSDDLEVDVSFDEVDNEDGTKKLYIGTPWSLILERTEAKKAKEKE